MRFETVKMCVSLWAHNCHGVPFRGPLMVSTNATMRSTLQHFLLKCEKPVYVAERPQRRTVKQLWSSECDWDKPGWIYTAASSFTLREKGAGPSDPQGRRWTTLGLWLAVCESLERGPRRTCGRRSSSNKSAEDVIVRKDELNVCAKTKWGQVMCYASPWSLNNEKAYWSQLSRQVDFLFGWEVWTDASLKKAHI